MKTSDRIKRRAELVLAKIEFVARHIRNVEDNCLLLGKKLIERGDIDLGHKLIANGYVHDASKFHGIEFEYLSLTNPGTEEDKKLKLKLAIHHHNTTNPHHAEFWGGIEKMPEVYLAEFCCDVKARSEEFGTDLRQWIEVEATRKYRFTASDKVYKNIMEFVGLLCQKPFGDLSK